MLKLNKISKKVGIFSLQDIDFEVEKGDYFILVGESGAGKTMILEMICGLVKPDKGQILLNGNEIQDTPIQKRKIGIVYQEQSLFPHLNVFQNIAYSLKSRHLSKKQIEDRVNELAADTEISHILNRKTIKLSGGEAQRVAIARTLATDPAVLLLDEPLSFLDVQLKKGMSSLLRKINQKGQTIVHVTHDYDEVIALANKIAIIENGTIIQKGTPAEIFKYPKSEFVANFVGIKNFFKGILLKSESDSNIKHFETKGIIINIISNETENTEGFITIPSESITISEDEFHAQDNNILVGSIKDIFPVKQGLEIVIGAGFEISTIISYHLMEKLQLEIGKKVWIEFKPDAVIFTKN